MGCCASKPETKKEQQHTKGDEKSGEKDRERMLKLGGILEQPTGDVRDYYKFGAVIGKGNFGIVHKVTNRKTGETFACKSISKRKMVCKDDVEDVKREVQVLMHLSGHPNIVKMYSAFEDNQYIHFVMECCEGGELFDRIAARGKFTERMAAEAMRSIVSVVNHCHHMNVVHRDLKPENFLMTTPGDDAVIKATDFGLSRFFKDGSFMEEIVGSPFYVAPEVLQRHYGKEADIWSCGVILYILLAGYPPFHADETQQIFKKIISKPLDLSSKPWPQISEAAKSCVRGMLARDPRKRLTAEQLLRHEWMREHGAAIDTPLQPEVLIRLKQFGQMNMFKREVLRVIASKLPPAEIQGLKEMFKAIDLDGTGLISVEELQEALRKRGASITATEVETILEKIDIDGNKKLDYEEFLAATIHLGKLEREELMMEAFKHFDKDGSGVISKPELDMALQEAGLDPQDIAGIMAAADTNSDGCIDYSEFCVMMRNQNFEQLVEASTRAKTHWWQTPPELSVVDELEMPAEGPMSTGRLGPSPSKIKQASAA